MIHRFDPAQTCTFNFPTRIRFGAGVIKELGAYLKDNQLSRPLLVTDPVIRSLGFSNKLSAIWRARGSR